MFILYSVIFIDDEDMIRENIKYLADYSGNGFSLDKVFDNLHDAEKYMAENHVDLVMVDIVIGDESGLDFAEYCADKYPDTIVVIISAYKEFEYARRALDCNVFSYVPKPTTYDMLNNVLKKAHIKLEKIYTSYELLPARGEDGQKAEKVKKYIEETVFADRNMTRESVANFIGMTPTYFSKWFKSNFSKSYVHYINDVKIRRAMKLLRETDMPLNDICLECGYYTLHYFMNKFYEINGMTPNEYRKSGSLKNSEQDNR